MRTIERVNGARREIGRNRRGTRRRGGHRTVAATYVENRVTNHKRVYGGASDHWPQRIIVGYGRCRVSIRRTIEMKGCTRTVKADLVAIPRQADEQSGTTGIAIPPSVPLPFASPPSPPPCSPAWDAIRLRSAIRTDRPSLSVSNHLLPTLSLARISYPFFPLFLTKFSLGCSGLIATFTVDNGNRAESGNDSAQSILSESPYFRAGAVVVID